MEEAKIKGDKLRGKIHYHKAKNVNLLDQNEKVAFTNFHVVKKTKGYKETYRQAMVINIETGASVLRERQISSGEGRGFSLTQTFEYQENILHFLG